MFKVYKTLRPNLKMLWQNQIRKVADLEAEVARLREIESSLFRALKLAEESQQNFAAKMEKRRNQSLIKQLKKRNRSKRKLTQMRKNKPC